MADKTFRPKLSDEAEQRILTPLGKARKTTKMVSVPKADLEAMIADNSRAMQLLDEAGIKIDQWSEEDLI